MRKPSPCFLTTLMPDGSPQLTETWVDTDGEHVIINTVQTHQKIKNIRREPRVALSFIGQNTSKEGMREYVVAYGRARITEGGAVPLLQRLTPLYLGPKAEFPPASMRNIPGYITRIAPDRYSGIGRWAQRAGVSPFRGTDQST